MTTHPRSQLIGTACAAVAVFVLSAPAAHAATTHHYVSLRGDEGYLREGPTFRHPVLWVFRHKGYPFEVLNAYEDWRRVEAPDGTIGWMSAAILSDRRTVLVTATGRAPIRAAAARNARIVAFAEPGVVADLKACKPSACRISSGGVEGWIDKNNIWGVGAGEVFR